MYISINKHATSLRVAGFLNVWATSVCKIVIVKVDKFWCVSHIGPHLWIYLLEGRIYSQIEVIYSSTADFENHGSNCTKSSEQQETVAL